MKFTPVHIAFAVMLLGILTVPAVQCWYARPTQLTPAEAAYRMDRRARVLEGSSTLSDADREELRMIREEQARKRLEAIKKGD